MSRLTINYVWGQVQVPVIRRYAGKGQKHRLRLPYATDNRSWLSSLGKTKPEWNGGDLSYWAIPKSWFNHFVESALKRYGKFYIIQPFREQEVCAPACQNAAGHECQCSCMGANHGAGNDDSWFEVSDTFAVRWGDGDLACRLLTAR